MTTYINEQLCVKLTIDSSGSYKLESTAPSRESRLFTDEVTRWEADMLYLYHTGEAESKLEELTYDELKALAQAIFQAQDKDNIYAEKVFAEIGKRVIYSTIP